MEESVRILTLLSSMCFTWKGGLSLLEYNYYEEFGINTCYNTDNISFGLTYEERYYFENYYVGEVKIIDSKEII